MNNSIQNVDAKDEAQIIWGCFINAVERFNKSEDRNSLLCPRNKDSQNGSAASERAIAYRLAFYLESELRSRQIVSDNSSLVVDCEYNRHQGALKALAVEEKLKRIVEEARNRKMDEPDEDGLYVFSVFPDIVVHERGNDRRNRLVIEIKKATNSQKPEYDLLKLELFTRPKSNESGYGYYFGAWVVAEDKLSPKERKLIIHQKFYQGKPWQKNLES